jgi:hypothetical protein
VASGRITATATHTRATGTRIADSIRRAEGKRSGTGPSTATIPSRDGGSSSREEEESAAALSRPPAKKTASNPDLIQISKGTKLAHTQERKREAHASAREEGGGDVGSGGRAERKRQRAAAGLQVPVLPFLPYLSRQAMLLAASAGSDALPMMASLRHLSAPTTRPTPLLQTAKRFPPTQVRMPTEPPHPFLCSFLAATLYSHAFSEKDANIFRKKVGNAPCWIW